MTRRLPTMTANRQKSGCNRWLLLNEMRARKLPRLYATLCGCIRVVVALMVAMGSWAAAIIVKVFVQQLMQSV